MQGSLLPKDSLTQQEWAQYILNESKKSTSSTNKDESPVKKPSHNRRLRKKRPIDWSEQFVYIDSDCDSDYQPSKRSRCGTEDAWTRGSPARYIKREPGISPSFEEEKHTGQRSFRSQHVSWDNESTRGEGDEGGQEPDITAIEQHFQTRLPMSVLEARDDLAKEQNRSKSREDRGPDRPLSEHTPEHPNQNQNVPVTLPASSYGSLQLPGPPVYTKVDEPAVYSIFLPGRNHSRPCLTNISAPPRKKRADSNTAVEETIKGSQSTKDSKSAQVEVPEHYNEVKSQQQTASSPLLPIPTLQLPMQIDNDVRAIEALCPLLPAGSWMIVKSAMQQGVVNLDHWQPDRHETIQRPAPDKKGPTADSVLGKVFDIHDDIKTLSSDERLATWLKMTIELVFTFPR